MMVVGTYFEDPNVQAATGIVFLIVLKIFKDFVNSVSRPEINTFQYQKAISFKTIKRVETARNWKLKELIFRAGSESVLNKRECPH